MTEFPKETVSYFLSKGLTLEQIKELNIAMNHAAEKLYEATRKPRSAEKLGLDYDQD